jgi:photosystem II stability/assembly factor-like uncharacterized protein
MPKIVAALALSLLAAGCGSVLPPPAEGRAEPERHPHGARQRAQARRLADGTIPADAVMAAWHARERMQALDDLGAPVQWTWLGPGNVGGRLRAVLIDPTNPSRIWVGAAGGGVWRSDDAGASWQPMNGLLTMLGCGCMALDPADPDHLWFGSGEGFFDAVEGSSNTAILRGAGLFESFDAGATWSRVASTANPDWHFVNRLAVLPQNPQVLLAATGSGIWRSTDGGQTWSRRTTERAFDVDFHPTDATRAVAGRTDGRALWSIDGGVTWSAVTISAASTRIELAYARSNPSVVYCTASDVAEAIHVFRSLDGGQSWAQRSTSSIATYSLYNNCLWVDPTNANNLLYGGVQLYRSTDGGASRTQSTTGAHPDYHVVVEHPGFDGVANRRVYTGNDGGLHTRADWQTGTWTSLNNGLGVTQFYGAAMHAQSGVMVAGAQDNGTSRFTGNANAWNYNVIGGDGGFCASDPTDANVFYGGYQHFGAQRSSNAGANWTSIAGATTGDTGFNFIPYFLLDPNDPNRMLACGRALWRTNDVKTGSPPAWTQIKAGRACADDGAPGSHFEDNPPCNHSTAQIALGNSDVVWVGHNDGEVHRTANATAAQPTWSLVDGIGGQLPDRWISSIAIDPADHAHVLVSCMGYAPDNVFETRDNGASWQPIAGSGTGALPALPVSWLSMHPRLPSLLFAATDLGLFCSTDGGARWAPIAGGPENVCIDQLVWKTERELLCVTHGRGVWLATLPIAAVQPAGPGCAAGAPPQLTSSPPVVGGTANLAMSGARSGALVFLAYSIGAPQPQTFGACTVAVDLPNSAPFATGPTSAAGAWAHALAIPPFSGLIGLSLTAQTFVVGIGGPMVGAGDLSTALRLDLGL